MKWTHWHGAAWILGVLLVGPISGARAQVGHGARLNRPSSMGASQRIDLIGGRYTYEWGASGRGVTRSGQQYVGLNAQGVRSVSSRIGMVGGSSVPTGPARPGSGMEDYSATQALGLSFRPPNQGGNEYAATRLGPVYIPRDMASCRRAGSSPP